MSDLKEPLALSPIWIALRLPFIPLEAWGITADEPSHVLITEKSRIISASKMSLAEISIGASTSTAGMALNAKVLTNSNAKNQALLSKIAQTVYQFTPHYEHIQEDGILLEISSCIKLFKSPEILLEKLLFALQQCYQEYCKEGITDEVRSSGNKKLLTAVGVAHTRLGAWILSFQSLPAEFGDLPRRSLSALLACGLDRLTEYPKVVERLKRTGFATLGDLLLQSGFELRDRYGTQFVNYISSILGLDLTAPQESQNPAFLSLKSGYKRPIEIPQYRFIERFDLETPTSSLSELKDVFKCLLIRLQQHLLKQQKQCEKLCWVLYSIYRDESRHVLNVPGLYSQWEFALELTQLYFDNVELPFEVDAIVLDCENTTSLECTTPSLFSTEGSDQDEAKLLTKLSARLGKSAIFKLQHINSHIPEYSTQRVAVNAKMTTTSHMGKPPLIFKLRPAWLLRTPQRLRQCSQGLFYKGKLRLLSGPERIQQPWGDEVVWRDYFIAVQEDASRLWIYKDLLNQQWYLHGLF